MILLLFVVGCTLTLLMNFAPNILKMINRLMAANLVSCKHTTLLFVSHTNLPNHALHHQLTPQLSNFVLLFENATCILTTKKVKQNIF